MFKDYPCMCSHYCTEVFSEFNNWSGYRDLSCRTEWQVMGTIPWSSGPCCFMFGGRIILKQFRKSFLCFLWYSCASVIFKRWIRKPRSTLNVSWNLQAFRYKIVVTWSVMSSRMLEEMHLQVTLWASISRSTELETLSMQSQRNVEWIQVS
jgi:hypothetical protein